MLYALVKVINGYAAQWELNRVPNFVCLLIIFELMSLNIQFQRRTARFFVVLDNEIKELECLELFAQQSETEKHLRMEQDERESHDVFVSQFIFLPKCLPIFCFFFSGVFVCGVVRNL